MLVVPQSRAWIGGLAGLRGIVVTGGGHDDFRWRAAGAGGAEWPTQLDDLGDARPVVLWVRGQADLRFACVNSVSMVGSRAATGYGNHVAIEMAAALSEHGVGVVSGGA